MSSKYRVTQTGHDSIGESLFDVANQSLPQ
jgi:hypothetical protein